MAEHGIIFALCLVMESVERLLLALILVRSWVKRLSLRLYLLVWVVLTGILGGHTVCAQSVLPKGVWSPMIGFGAFRNLDTTFDSSGTLKTLKAEHSVTLDSKTLTALAPEAKEAVDFINSTTPTRLGDLLHLGVIEIDVKPTINYYSPILAYGFSDRFTLGVGFPVISYKNDVNVRHYGSNVQAFQSHFSGIEPSITNAFTQMAGIERQFHETIIDKGYQPLTSREESFIGDTIVSAQYMISKNEKTRFLSKTNFNLPTGPKADPDDLLALSTFGKTSIEQQIVGGWILSPKFSLIGKLGIKIGIPDTIEKRVPKSEGDLLPGLETKETVNRTRGISTSYGLGANFNMSESFSMSAGMDFGAKQKDKYSGGRGQRYDLLENGTSSNWTVASLDFSYSTVDAFMREEVLIPFIISYEFSDVISGTNTEKQTFHGVNLTLFYK